MKQEECGQVTVFLSLLLISFFMVISICVEGIYAQMQKADFTQRQQLAGEYAQANFHKELAEQFHVFAIDGRYASKMETVLKRKLQQNSSHPITEFSVSDQVSITEQDGGILKHQIREYMKYREAADLVSRIRQSFRGVEDDEEVGRLESTINGIEEKTGEGEENGEETADKSEQTEDPRKGLTELLKTDILDLVMPAGSAVSDREVSVVYGKKETKKDLKVDFFHKESVSELVSDANKGSALSRISTEALGILYADHCFRNALDQYDGTGIRYEMEYLISGRATDRDNLKSVVYRLLAIRFASNYAYLLSDSKSQAEAYAVAAAIANIGSAVPGVVEGIRLLILAAWAYGESIVDLRGLLKGKRIPFVKSAGSWQLQLSGLGSLSASEKENQKGNSYEDYLKILLLLQLNANEKYMRMMDVMEQRIQEVQADFQLSACIFSYRMTVSMQRDSLFYPLEQPLTDSRIYVY